MSITDALPWWARCSVLILAGGALYALGLLHGEREAGQAHMAYVAAQAERTVVIAQRQAEVIIRTEIKYRDRIKTVYVKGEEIEKQVPLLVSPADDRQPGVSIGFVRSYNAAWTGEPAGLAAESDRDAAGIPLAEVAETDAYNATACRAWRNQALGLREFYERLQATLE